ncbi:MAG: FAD-binding oxidoreductase [Rhodoferax sp.]
MNLAALLLGLCAGLALLGGTLLTLDGMRHLFGWRTSHPTTRFSPLRVAKREEIGPDLLRLHLEHPRQRPLVRARPGQHVMLQATHTAPALRRAYSLANWCAHAPGAYELCIRREPLGRMSRWLWDNAQEGSLLQVSRPQGDFTPANDLSPWVLIAGGVGITALRPMLHQALAQGRRCTLFHAARAPQELLYFEEFSQMARQQPARMQYLPIVSRPAPSWNGLRGRLDAAQVYALAPHCPHAQVYLCTSAAMEAGLREGLLAHGVRPAQLHSEAFGVQGSTPTADLPITLVRADGRHTLRTGQAPTLLHALENASLAPASECRAGHCGQCRMRLNAGEVHWLLRPECAVPPQHILPCVCVAHTPLELQAP